MRLILFAAALLLLNASFAPAQRGAFGNPILTPKPGLAPKINGSKIYGARPGHPFLYRIPCTGLRPIRFSAEGLPPSLHVDAQTGIITGSVPQRRGEFAATFRASNGKGSDARAFKLIVGDVLALTPPMGWNDWYTYYDRFTEKTIREAADAMIASGMADFGYAFVNIDGTWTMKPGSEDPMLSGEPRDGSGTLCPNRRLGDMKALTDHIHAKGLKAGIYSSPGPVDCAGYATSWGHEEADAATFARWGFDFLKYDWCSYGKVAPHTTLEDYQRPYRLMGEILRKLDRDIVFNLCQYGMKDVWTWGGDVGGNTWRTTGDLGLAKDTQLPGFYSVGFENSKHNGYAGPGRWNDPDYILIGFVGDARENDPTYLQKSGVVNTKRSPGPKPTPLTADEQYSYMSMWSLMAAPLFYGGDMTRLDAFTLNVLCNSEVIDVNQDVLGKQAIVVRHSANEFVLSKPLEGGDLAVGLFNLTQAKAKLAVDWEELGLKGPYRIRDVWRQKEIGNRAGGFSAMVGPHGVALIRLTRSE